MGRGLSKDQVRILGVAYHANRITQPDGPRPKCDGAHPDERFYRAPVVVYGGAGDMSWQLAAHVVKGLPFAPVGLRVIRSNGADAAGGYVFDTSDPHVKAVKASICRAMTSLEERGHLALALSSTGRSADARNYVLTDSGLEIGAQAEESFDPGAYIRCGLAGWPSAPSGPGYLWEAARGVPLLDVMADEAFYKQKASDLAIGRFVSDETSRERAVMLQAHHDVDELFRRAHCQIPFDHPSRFDMIAEIIAVYTPKNDAERSVIETQLAREKQRVERENSGWGRGHAHGGFEVTKSRAQMIQDDIDKLQERLAAATAPKEKRRIEWRISLHQKALDAIPPEARDKLVTTWASAAEIASRAAAAEAAAQITVSNQE